MFEQIRCIFNRENRGLPDFLLPRAGKCNTMWGSDYVVYVCDVLNESVIDVLIDALIEDFLVLRELELQRF